MAGGGDAEAIFEFRTLQRPVEMTSGSTVENGRSSFSVAVSLGDGSVTTEERGGADGVWSDQGRGVSAGWASER